MTSTAIHFFPSWYKVRIYRYHPTIMVEFSLFFIMFSKTDRTHQTVIPTDWMKLSKNKCFILDFLWKYKVTNPNMHNHFSISKLYKPSSKLYLRLNQRIHLMHIAACPQSPHLNPSENQGDESNPKLKTNVLLVFPFLTERRLFANVAEYFPSHCKPDNNPNDSSDYNWIHCFFNLI